MIDENKFLEEKKPISYYDSALKVAMNKKGKGFLVKLVVRALSKHYGKTISSKYLKQFTPQYKEIVKLEKEKERLKRAFTLSNDFGQEESYRIELDKVKTELSSLRKKASKKIANIKQNYNIGTEISLYSYTGYDLIPKYKTVHDWGYNKKGEAVLFNSPLTRNIKTCEEWKHTKQEVIFNLVA